VTAIAGSTVTSSRPKEVQVVKVIPLLAVNQWRTSETTDGAGPAVLCDTPSTTDPTPSITEPATLEERAVAALKQGGSQPPTPLPPMPPIRLVRPHTHTHTDTHTRTHEQLLSPALALRTVVDAKLTSRHLAQWYRCCHVGRRSGGRRVDKGGPVADAEPCSWIR
jgi:hypothetical protein